MGMSRKLTKLKSALKKLPSFAKTDRSISDESAATGGKLHPVYVGRSRRRYLVSSEVIGHPLFRVLVDRSEDGAAVPAGSGDGDDEGVGVVVACEVVMFKHLLWMLENGGSHHLESTDEVVELYGY